MAEQPRSTADILKDATANLQTIVRKEVELAKLEIQEGVQQQMAGAGMFAAAGVLALFVLGFAGVTAAVALQNVLEPWAAWLIVTGVFLLLAVVLVLVGKRVISRANPSPEQAKASIQENVEWAKQQIGR